MEYVTHSSLKSILAFITLQYISNDSTKTIMLVSTGILFNLKNVIKTIQGWNLFPLQYPYKVNIQKEEPVHYISINALFLQRDWKLYCFILIYTATLTIIKAILESNSALDRFMLVFGIYFSFVNITAVCFHKHAGKSFCNFLNQLIKV